MHQPERSGGAGQQGEVRDGTVKVDLSPDRMAAYLVVTPPLGGGQPVTFSAALAALEAAGVKYGIDTDAVQAAVTAAAEAGPEAQSFPRPVLVARGQPPVRGRDGFIEYLPALLDPGGRPRERPDGGVDLFDLGLVRNVPKGTILAVRHPPDPGQPGVNVLGEAVAPPPVQDVRIRAGRGVELSPDGNEARAAIDGHAVLQDGLLTVSAVFQVDGDVGPATGNIDFVGSVVVRGHVLAGFSVRAEQDVEVFGGVEGSITAGGNVHVRYGIQGGGRGGVRAGRNVRARFIENAHVRAGGDVLVSDGILHSRVEAAGRVEVLGRRGCIIGGHLRVGSSVTARILGAALATQTEIAVGCSPEVREELEALRRDLHQLEEQMRRTEQAIRLLKQQEARGNLPAEKRALLLTLVRGQYQLTSRHQQALARQRELEQLLREAQGAWVRAQDVCYPGVRITIGSSTYTVTDLLRRVRFYLDDEGEVAFGPP